MDHLIPTDHPVIIITSKQLEEILADIDQCPDEERCGLIGGLHSTAERVYPVTNCLHSATRFRMHAQEQVKALLDIEQHGWELMTIYHSHPHGPGEPSETDTKEYSYPGVVYIIHNRLAKQHLRAFRLIEGEWLEIPITVVD